MITNYTISKEESIGVYQILVTLAEKWVDYGINMRTDSDKPKNRIGLTFYHGLGENTYYISMPDGFDSFDYLITSMQEKDQIIIIAIPKKALINKSVFKSV